MLLYRKRLHNGCSPTTGRRLGANLRRVSNGELFDAAAGEDEDGLAGLEDAAPAAAFAAAVRR